MVLRTHNDADVSTFEPLKKIGEGIDLPRKVSSKQYVFHGEQGYKGGHFDHLNNFTKGIRNQTPLTADVLFGVRTSSAALLSFDSYFRGEPIY